MKEFLQACFAWAVLLVTVTTIFIGIPVALSYYGATKKADVLNRNSERKYSAWEIMWAEDTIVTVESGTKYRVRIDK